MLAHRVMDATERLKQEDFKVRGSYCSESSPSVFGAAYWQVFLEEHLLT